MNYDLTDEERFAIMAALDQQICQLETGTSYHRRVDIERLGSNASPAVVKVRSLSVEALRHVAFLENLRRKVETTC